MSPFFYVYYSMILKIIVLLSVASPVMYFWGYFFLTWFNFI